ncbi:TPA: hypothetical protein ACS70L_001918 [Providencia alcalifaciens]
MTAYKNQIQSLLARVFVSAIGFILSIIIVRLYNKDLVSAYFLYVSFGNLCAQILTFGSSPTVNKVSAEGAPFKEIIKNYISQYRNHLILLAFPLIIIPLIYNQINSINLFIVAVLLFSLVFQTEILKGRGEYIYSQLFTGAISNTIFLLISFIANYTVQVNINGLILFWSFSLIISNLLCLLVNKKKDLKIKKTTPYFDIKRTKKVYISMIIIYCFSQIDLWVIATLFNDDIVAQYALSTRLALLLTFPIMAVRNITASKIPLLINQDKKKLQIEISKSCSFSFIISLLAFLFLLATGKFFIVNLYGNDYSETFYLLLIFSIGQLVNSLTGPCDQLLTHTGKEGIFLKLTVASFSLLVLLISILYLNKINNVYYYALSVSFTVIIQNFSISYFVYKKLRIVSLPARVNI